MIRSGRGLCQLNEEAIMSTNFTINAKSREDTGKVRAAACVV
ncbi:MAG: hypothetical protein CM15mP51_10730 [Porticoccaceae bacterium]|nr:MAG: hypothetical protein CM15mP51_10730 [Porticoccaceae bacterium]